MVRIFSFGGVNGRAAAVLWLISPVERSGHVKTITPQLFVTFVHLQRSSLRINSLITDIYPEASFLCFIPEIRALNSLKQIIVSVRHRETMILRSFPACEIISCGIALGQLSGVAENRELRTRVTNLTRTGRVHSQTSPILMRR